MVIVNDLCVFSVTFFMIFDLFLPFFTFHSCLNGTFQFWSIAKKAVSLQVDQKKLGCKWVEDMCWIDNGRALLLAMENDGQDPRRLLGISTVDAAAAAANGGSRIKCRFAHLNQEAAKETLNAVVGLGANQNSFQFAVAGNEKRVVRQFGCFLI